MTKALRPYNPLRDSLFDTAQEMSELFQDMFDVFEPVNKLPSRLVSSSFPPANIYTLKEDNTLVYEFAVAGYSEEHITLSFEEDYLTLSLTKTNDTESEKKLFIQRGIKMANAEIRCFVPASKYDVKKAQATLSGGILRVSIPIREEAKPFKIFVEKN